MKDYARSALSAQPSPATPVDAETLWWLQDAINTMAEGGNQSHVRFLQSLHDSLAAQPSPVAYHGDVDLKWLSGSIGEVAHRLSTYMPTGLAEWTDRARDCRIAAQVLSELSAQPSPGDQGDALAALQQEYDKLLAALDRQVEAAEKIAATALEQDDRIEELEEALAARQPVGEPVARLVEAVEGECNGLAISRETAAAILAHVFPAIHAAAAYMVDGRLEQALCFDRQKAENIVTFNAGEVVPLFRWPAQAVDLGAVREALQRITLGFNGDLPYIKGIAEALALIDSKVVGNG